jgi:hypothetical protein
MERRTLSATQEGRNASSQGVDILSAKLDLLMKKLDEHDQKKEVMHIHDTRMTCEECGGTGHIGSNCPEVREDANYINNNSNYRPQ